MTVDEMITISKKIRQEIIKMLFAAGSGHSAGSLSVVEILVALYFHTLRHRPQEPEWPDRDRLILSCGHAAPALYAVMAKAGYFSEDKLSTLRQFGSSLQGHPHNLELPGIEVSSGPLGQGLSQAIGMALAARLDGRPSRIYCVMSDGEQDEGQIWEAAMLAAKEKLTNLVAIVDRNNIQIDGCTEDIMPLEPLKDKYEAFNWCVFEADGNNIKQLIDALDAAFDCDKPVLIIANTVAGKGVDFIEGDYSWHGKAPNKEEMEKALKQLEAK